MKLIALIVALLTTISAGAPATQPLKPPALVDITPLVAKTPAGGTLDLKPLNPPQGSYVVPAQLVLVKAITIHGHGSTLVAPAEHGVFDCHAAVIIDGFTCSKANIFFHVNSGVKNCELSNCTLSGVLNAVKVEDGGGICKVENVYAKSSSVTYYGTLSLLHCTGQSVGEYAIRLEGNGMSLISGGEYTNAGNAFGKDTIGARAGSAMIIGVTIHGNIRVGQEPPTGPPLPMGSASRLQITGCTFMDQSKGHTYVEVKQGCEIWEWANVWKPAKEPAFAAVSAGSALHHSAPATQPAK